MTDMNKNFSKRVINLNEGDSLFFDTNVLADYLNASSKNHLAIKHFIIHTVNQGCVRLISSTALQELLYITAKELFITEQLLNCNYSSKPEATSAWIELPKQRKPENLRILSHYNQKALQSIRTLYPLFEVAESTEAEIGLAFNISVSYPLHAADSFIMSNAVTNGGALVSIDGDMRTTLNVVPVYYCSKSGFNPSLYENVEGHYELYEQIYSTQASNT